MAVSGKEIKAALIGASLALWLAAIAYFSWEEYIVGNVEAEALPTIPPATQPATEIPVSPTGGVTLIPEATLVVEPWTVENERTFQEIVEMWANAGVDYTANYSLNDFAQYSLN